MNVLNEHGPFFEGTLNINYQLFIILYTYLIIFLLETWIYFLSQQVYVTHCKSTSYKKNCIFRNITK